jgi:hypothetical protein
MEAQFGYSELLEGIPGAVATAPSFLDRLSKFLSPCPAAEWPHWPRQPLARY